MTTNREAGGSSSAAAASNKLSAALKELQKFYVLMGRNDVGIIVGDVDVDPYSQAANIKAANIKDFVKQVVTEDRLEQCWGVIEQEYGEGNITTKQIVELMGWIFKDIISEEGDALAHNNLCKKDIGSEVANTARPWFINKINSF